MRDVDEAVGRHVADSLVRARRCRSSRGARRIADLGSGAGWPGLALAAALPDAHVCARRERDPPLPLPGARRRGRRRWPTSTVVNARAEEWPDGLGAHDLVTARALAALPVILEYAAPLLADGGHVVRLEGRGRRRRRRRRAPRRRRSSGSSRSPVVSPSTPYAGARDHTLHAFRKIAPTPERFPRRPGMATKRPLGDLKCPARCRRDARFT